MKLKASLLITLMLSFLASLTLTSCDDNGLAVDSSINSSSAASISDIAPPTMAKLVVVNDTTGKIVVTGANNESNFVGYLLTNSDNKIIDSIGIGAAFAGDTSFMVKINRDVAATYNVVSFNDDGEFSTAVTATFAPRMSYGPYSVTKIVATTDGGQGIAISADSIYLATIADSIATKSYIDGGQASLFFENTKSGTATITPANGGKVVALASNKALLTQAQIDAIKALAIGTDLADGYKVLADGTVVYTNGKSVRPDNDPTASPIDVAAGQSYFVMSALGAYARVDIDAVDATTGTVTCTVYAPSTNEGAPLFKK